MQRKQPSLRSLEKNILKYRALQLVLLLHHVESLKSYVFGSIKVTDDIFQSGDSTGDNTTEYGKTAWGRLVDLGILTVAESEDIQNIIKTRNDIGHRVHKLFCDISGPDFMLDTDAQYDYGALQRLSAYRAKIENGMRCRFIQQIGFRELAFEQAELTMIEELRRLDRRIINQIEARRREIVE